MTTVPAQRRRAAVYVRISTDEAHQPWSLSAQEERLAAYCVSQGWLVVGVYVEQASGATLARPELTRLLSDAQGGDFDVLVVIALDRLSRNLAQMMGLIERLETAGVTLVSATQPFDTGTPTGRLLLQMLASFAEFERSLIVERVTAGTERRAKSGRWTSGRIPYGYARDPDTRGLAADPIRVSVVTQVFRWYVEERVGTLTIARRLNERGERTQAGKRWTPNTVTTVLRNRAYLGLVPWRGAYYPGLHPPIVDEALFAQAQAILQDRGEHPALRRGNLSDYLLTGLLRCAQCRSPYIGMSAKGHGGNYEYYTCQGRRRHGRTYCQNDPLPKHAVEAAVIAQLTILLAQTPLLEQAWQKAQSRTADRARDVQAELARVTHQEQILTAKRDRYLDAFEAGTLDPTHVADRLGDLKDQIDAIQTRRAAVTHNLHTHTNTTFPRDVIADRLRDLESLDIQPDPAKTKALLRLLIHRLTVHGRRDIRPTYRLPTPNDSGQPAQHDDVRPTLPIVGRAGIEPATLGLKEASARRRRLRHVPVLALDGE